ncbi:MAG TPA: hypothetical protein VGP70_26725 [Actinomadura sp.]|nr:hypothetical protein [Actinomadura sp.]
MRHEEIREDDPTPLRAYRRLRVQVIVPAGAGRPWERTLVAAGRAVAHGAVAHRDGHQGASLGSRHKG